MSTCEHTCQVMFEPETYFLGLVFHALSMWPWASPLILVLIPSRIKVRKVMPTSHSQNEDEWDALYKDSNRVSALGEE